MSDPYELDHAGLRCTLRPNRNLGFVVVGGLSAMWLGMTALFVARGGYVVGMGMMGALGVGMWLGVNVRTELRCDGRTLEWQRRWGPLRMPVRRVSLLDLAAIGSARGYLLLEPRPGPLRPLELDARETDPKVLAQIAAYLHEAIEHAERFRGDAPSAQTRAAAALVDARE